VAADSGPDDFLLVGRVARTHGNRGQVIVNPETDFADERFRIGEVVFVGPENRSVPRRITAVRFHQGRPIIGLDGIDSMNDAEALANAELWVSASTLPPLPPATFYRHDLVGCEVRDTGDDFLGRVTDVQGPLERSYLVVESARGEVLIPMVETICVRVDPKARVIVVDPPDGLLDANTR
jgi:16S rRNA processing protein RimM